MFRFMTSGSTRFILAIALVSGAVVCAQVRSTDAAKQPAHVLPGSAETSGRPERAGRNLQNENELDPAQALAQRYCGGCHNDRTKSGGFSFAQLDIAHPGRTAPLAENVILRVRSGLMPPSGLPRPGARELQAFAATLERRIDAESRPDPGRPLLHRLNRAEYRNAVSDLLDLDVDVERWLPADNITQGFDNLSEALTVTPTLMEVYATAAGRIARLAVGDPDASVGVDVFRLPTNYSQTRHVEGAPPVRGAGSPSATTSRRRHLRLQGGARLHAQHIPLRLDDRGRTTRNRRRR